MVSSIPPASGGLQVRVQSKCPLVSELAPCRATVVPVSNALAKETGPVVIDS